MFLNLKKVKLTLTVKFLLFRFTISTNKIRGRDRIFSNQFCFLRLMLSF